MKRLIAIVPIILMMACGKNSLPVEKNNAVPVTTVPAVRKSYSPTLFYTGTVYASREANVGAALPGRIEKLYVSEGDAVQKGDLLAELSDELLTTAKIEYQTLKKDFERVKRLNEKNAVATQKLDHVEAQYEAAEAKYNLLLQNTQIRAPFSGVVVEKLLEEGEIFSLVPALTPGYSHATGIFRIMQLHPAIVEIEVGEKDLAQIKEGMKADIQIDSENDYSLNGTVSSVQPMLSTLSRTAIVKITLPNPDKTLKPGMFARVTLHLPEKEGIFLPRQAVMRETGTSIDYVFVVQNHQACRLIISRIAEEGDDLVVDGIEAEQQVVLAGKQKLKDGTPVDLGGQI